MHDAGGSGDSAEFLAAAQLRGELFDLPLGLQQFFLVLPPLLIELTLLAFQFLLSGDELTGDLLELLVSLGDPVLQIAALTTQVQLSLLELLEPFPRLLLQVGEFLARLPLLLPKLVSQSLQRSTQFVRWQPPGQLHSELFGRQANFERFLMYSTNFLQHLLGGCGLSSDLGFLFPQHLVLLVQCGGKFGG